LPLIQCQAHVGSPMDSNSTCGCPAFAVGRSLFLSMFTRVLSVFSSFYHITPPPSPFLGFLWSPLSRRGNPSSQLVAQYGNVIPTDESSSLVRAPPSDEGPISSLLFLPPQDCRSFRSSPAFFLPKVLLLFTARGLQAGWLHRRAVSLVFSLFVSSSEDDSSAGP